MFTLVVLAYNEEKYIKKTILELIEHFDTVIVVDDKSSDNTVTILEALSTKYNNLKIIRNKKYWCR